MLWMMLVTDAPVFVIRMWGKRWFRIATYIFLFYAIGGILNRR